MQKRRRLPDPLPVTEVFRLAQLAHPAPLAAPKTNREIEAELILRREERRRQRPWYQQIVALNGGREPTREDLTTLQAGKAPDVCPRCYGAGWLRPDVPFGHPSFAKRTPCECRRAEVAAKQGQRLMALADLTDEMIEYTFVNFQQALQPEAYAAAHAFAHDADAPPWLFMEGMTGTGKTHLMSAIAHVLLEQQRQVVFRVVPALLDWFKAGFDADDFQVRFDDICQVEVLLLDDLGAEHETAWTKERLFTLINYRYARRLKTVFSTNDELPLLEDRIRSRISDTVICEQILMRDFDYRESPMRKAQGKAMRGGVA